MIIDTRGIVIKNTKYSDTSVISKIYTRELGMQTYIINRIHSPKAPIKPSLLQPLTILEISAYHNKLKSIQRLKEAKTSPNLNSIPFEVVKSSIGLFISEVLYICIKEEEPNEALFDFLVSLILHLDNSPDPQPLFPLYFMLSLSKFLGFPPHNNRTNTNNIFHLKEGEFMDSTDNADLIIEGEDSLHLSQILSISLVGMNELNIPKPSRNSLMNKIIMYYSLHIPSFTNLKSLPVLISTLK